MSARRALVAATVALTVLVGCSPEDLNRALDQVTATTRANPAETVSADPPVDLLNPDVTPATIRSTICVGGWTATVRPPSSYTTALKRRQIVAYGYADRSLGSYEEDHVVPLTLGGHPSNAANLYPEPHALSEPDDPLEVSLGRDVCAGRVSLAKARQRIYQVKVAHGYDRTKSVAA